jgi:micrococcal nuclease
MVTPRIETTHYVSMMNRTAWSTSLLASVVFLAAASAGSGKQLVSGETEVAVEIIDGDTLVLGTGQQVRLVGLQAPKLPLGRTNFESWPLAKDAAEALRELTKGKKLTLEYGGRRMDRHGRILAHLFDESRSWIQGAMLRRGMARVYSFADNRSLVAEMLAIESEARAAKRGIWAHPYYRIRDHKETPRYTESFQLVEGRVHAVASVREWTYVNFEEDWRHDFTISVRRQNLKDFLSAGLDPATLEGRRIRVRGWVRWFNGPMIESTHPEQIEVLDQ